MAYMCIKSNRECDGCMECYPKSRCRICDCILDEADIDEDDGLCYACRDELAEGDKEDES